MAELDEERDDRSPAEQHHDSIKDDLRAAFDKAEAEAQPSDDSTESMESDSPPVRSERQRDEHGRFLPRDAAPQQPPDEARPPVGRRRQEAPAELETPPKAAKAPPAAPRDPVEAMPAAYKPEHLETWKQLPRAFREELHRRENEQAAFVAQAAPLRQLVGQLQQAVQPYQALLAAEGGSIPNVVRNYLQAATLMRNGSGQAKADWIAKLASQFTRKEDLLMLDRALAREFNIPYPDQPNGQPPPTTYHQPPPTEFRDPRLDEFLARQQQDRELAMQADLQSAVDEKQQWIAEVQPEFLPWVGRKMAQLLETAARDDEDLSYQDAYDTACRMVPEVRKILDQRAEAERAKPTPIERSRRAAVSLRPQGAVAPAPGGEANSLRSDISDAWESIVGR